MKKNNQITPPLLAILFLMGFGLVQVYSSSFIFATESLGDGLFFFKRQAIATAIALTVLITASRISFQIFMRWGWMLWLAAGVGVALTLIPGLGVRVGGAARWLNLPLGFRFEPSELLKFSFAILLATRLVAATENRSWLQNLVDSNPHKDANLPLIARLPLGQFLLILLLPPFLLLLQPDFGSFAIISMVAFAIAFAFGLRWRWVVGAALAAIPAFYVLVMQVPYRRARVLAFLDPWADPEKKGFQVIQSMLTFHSGGLTGAGLGQGQGKLFFLPEAHTDFTFAVLGEELGFVGVLAILSLYVYLVTYGIRVALRARESFHRATALGISISFGLSASINMGVVMGLLPTKGLALPFLSYGGSSLIVMCLMLGLLLNIDKNVDWRTAFK